MRKKTTKKEEPVENDASDQTKPWNKQFDDDRDDDGNLSRVATRKKKRGGSILAIVVWVALALVIIVPVAWQAIRSNTVKSGGDYTQDKITVTSTRKKPKSTSSTSSSHSSSQKQSSKSSRTSSSSQSSSSTVSSRTSSQSSVSSQTQSSSVSSSVSSSSASTASATSTYTVKAGDNLYRIAVNHGMTLSELLAANGLSSGANISSGQVLKVK